MLIGENLSRVAEQIDLSCRRAGRARGDVALMAVSKVHPAEAILEAYAAGHRLFGENRVQEFAAKQLTISELEDAHFHLIGPLQSNKTARAAELFTSIDTVDSPKIAQRLEAAATSLGKTLPILIEVKLSPEEAKHGIAPEHLSGLLRAIEPLSHLEVRGLMTVPPWSEEPEAARPYFRRLRQLRDGLQPLYPSLTELSIGMSNDFQVAIEEGSTTVRLGTAIFGRRPPPSTQALMTDEEQASR